MTAYDSWLSAQADAYWEPCEPEADRDGEYFEEEVNRKVKKLEQENKELKENYQKLFEFCKQIDISKSEQHSQWVQRCTENHLADIRKIENYRKALEEIKEVATLDDINCTISPETMNVSKDVLKIINEVLND